MIRMVFAIMLVALVGSSYAVFHENSRGAQVHTPFRWVFANGTARIAQSVVANDTDKVAYQRSDSSVWVLRDNSPVTWVCLNKGLLTFNAGSVYSSYNEADIDTSPDARFGKGKIDTAILDVIDSVKFRCGTTYTDFYAFDTTFACSLYDGTTYRATGSAAIQVRGDVATLTLPALSGTITVSTNTQIHIPDRFRAQSGWAPVIPISILDATEGYTIGLFQPYSSSIKTSANDYLAAGTGGLGFPISVTYRMK